MGARELWDDITQWTRATQIPKGHIPYALPLTHPKKFAKCCCKTWRNDQCLISISSLVSRRTRLVPRRVFIILFFAHCVQQTSDSLLDLACHTADDVNAPENKTTQQQQQSRNLPIIPHLHKKRGEGYIQLNLQTRGIYLAGLFFLTDTWPSLCQCKTFLMSYLTVIKKQSMLPPSDAYLYCLQPVLSWEDIIPYPPYRLPSIPSPIPMKTVTKWFWKVTKLLSCFPHTLPPPPRLVSLYLQPQTRGKDRNTVTQSVGELGKVVTVVEDEIPRIKKVLREKSI